MLSEDPQQQTPKYAALAKTTNTHDPGNGEGSAAFSGLSEYCRENWGIAHHRARTSFEIEIEPMSELCKQYCSAV